MKYFAINHNGKLAVASAWFPHYDKPVMVRNVWTTKHAWDERYSEMSIDSGLPVNGDTQPWALLSCMSGRIAFATAIASDEAQEGERIKPPRKAKGQSRPYRWEAGQWTKFYQSQPTGFERVSA